jgi:hypothetical protein
VLAPASVCPYDRYRPFVPGAARNILHVTAVPAYGEHVDIVGGLPPIAHVPCAHSVPHACVTAVLPNLAL